MVRLLGMLFLMGLSAMGGYLLSPHTGPIKWPWVFCALVGPEPQPSVDKPSGTLPKTGVSREIVTLTNIYLGTDVSDDFATLEDLCKAVNGGGGGRESCARLR